MDTYRGVTELPIVFIFKDIDKTVRNDGFSSGAPEKRSLT